ncbi:MAG: hypothetical protein HYS18_07655 [Burkholderiales bacterium]|nr:hypothetical protein [Burkholderiales bacterium]
MKFRSSLAIIFCFAAFSSQAATGSAQRCSKDVEWTDEVVAETIDLSLERLTALKVQRSLSNQEICTMPEAKLKRALFRLDNPKPDSPGEWAKFRKLQQKSDNGIVKPNGLWDAFLQRKQKLLAQLQASGPVLKAAGISSNQWTALGPGNIGGRVRSIVVHPTNPSKLWAGSVGGGIWASNDAGASWAPANDFMANIAVSSMVIDTTNPNLMYAATGESFPGDGIRGAGVFKSTDGGVTWAQLPKTNPAVNGDWNYVNRLAISSSNGNILLAATPFGIYRSTDAGANWTRVYTEYTAHDIRFDPNNGNNAVAGLGNGGVAYTRDAGANWNRAPLPNYPGRVEIAYAKGTSNLIYASVDDNYGKIYRSTDGGVNWANISSPQHLGGQGWYSNTIWVDPINSSTLVIGGLDLFRSTDGGVNWMKISTWWAAPRSPHADHHAIVSDSGYNGSSNRRVYFGNDGGVYRADDISGVTDDASGAGRWTSLNNGLAITQFYGGAGHANGVLTGGTQDNGTLLYTGNANAWRMYAGGDGGYAAIDSKDPRFMFGEYQNMQLHRSKDGGYTYNRVSDGLNDQYYNFIAPLILDPNDGNRFLAGGSQLWLATNAKAETVTMKSIKAAASTSGGNNISAIAVHRGDSNIMWVGHNDGSLYRTANGTAATPTWTKISASLPFRYVTRILIDPDNSQKVYVAYGGYDANNLYKTSNNGSAWSDISGDMPSAPIRGLARHPTKPGWLYAGTEVGVFTSENDGASWSVSNDGPANVSVEDLFWMYNASTSLIAVTHGRGMFKVDLSPGFVCKTVSDTNPNHVTAGRAYAKTTGTWVTTTTYYAKNSNAKLGTSKTAQVQLAEIFPGYFQAGACPSALAAPKVDSISASTSGMNATITVAASDVNGDLARVEVQFDDDGNWWLANGTTSWTVSRGFDTYGTHKARARAVDVTGRTSELSAYVNFSLTQSQSCVTAKNTLHISAGRAHQCGTTYSPKACANGSNNDLGSSSTYFPATSSIKQTGTNYWVKVTTCP